MINLLPSEVKIELRAARMNTVLRKYFMTILFALIAIAMVFGAALYINSVNLEAYTQQRINSEQRLVEVQATKQQVLKYNTSLQMAKTVLDGEIRLTNLVENISSTLPPGAVLDRVALDAGNFTKPATVTARVNSINRAGVLESNLRQSGLFSLIEINSVQAVEVTAEDAFRDYPFLVQLEATIGPEAAKPGFAPQPATEKRTP